MEWLVSVFTGFLGWLIGHLQSAPQRRRGIEEGPQAALFGIEHGLNPASALQSDQAVLRSIFENVAMENAESVRKAAQSAGEAYARMLRRDAFEDCRRSNFGDADRAEWKRTFGKEMPPLSYDQGYLQAIKDVMSGATDEAAKVSSRRCGDTHMADWVDKSQRKFAGDPSYIYLDQFNPDGKLLGAELVSQTVVHTFRRGEAEQRGSEQ